MSIRGFARHLVLGLVFMRSAVAVAGDPIDRRALVTRHHPILSTFDPESPLSVGNGEFAFTADVTGLQTFAELYEGTLPLGTLSQWGWHTAPNPDRWSMDTFRYEEFVSHGRRVGYADIPKDQRTPEIEWLRANPHRLHLGRVGFRLLKADGTRARPRDLTGIEQTLDLWSGVLESRFDFEGEAVRVQTICHPALDVLAVRVSSPLLRGDRIGIEIRFPYGTGQPTAADWSRPDAHETRVTELGPGRVVFARKLDDDAYAVAARWTPAGALARPASHEFLLTAPKDAESLEIVLAFAPKLTGDEPPSFDGTRAAAREHWARFWSAGGAIDLSGSKDQRWRELERRIVLSQYLTAIQCAGTSPPQETGLTFNSWEGKFHLEMHWWHAVHFALWGRPELLERSLDFYARILPRAQATARRQGYRGARWPKMTSRSGVESPSSIGPFLIWQEPHPIYFSELAYRARPERAILDRFKEVVFETADFMASFATWDEATRRYVLGPPLQCAQEVFPKERTFNCTYELVYWRWGLETAQRWRERLGQPRDAGWDHVLAGLASPAVKDGKYLFAESAPDSYTDPRWARDHPVVTAALGVLPGPGVDPETMRSSLHWIFDHWDWPTTWGWDYPMVAMTAARLGEPGRAVDALLLDTPKNRYRPNGHNHQRPGLTIYLPGNGGLLTAVGMMAAGWDGAPERPAPGFPNDGQWTVRSEGLRPMP
jgi:hypothetical protein